MKNIIQFVVTKGQGGYTADGVNVPVVTEGSTFEELQANIREAVALYFEDENVIRVISARNADPTERQQYSEFLP